jgi:hypothetical protein
MASPGSAVQVSLPGATVDLITASAATKKITAAKAEEFIVARCPIQDVGAVGPTIAPAGGEPAQGS